MPKLIVPFAALAALAALGCVRDVKPQDGHSMPVGIAANPVPIEVVLRVPVNTRSDSETGGRHERPDDVTTLDGLPTDRTAQGRPAATSPSSNAATLELAAVHCPPDDRYGAVIGVGADDAALETNAADQCKAAWKDCCVAICSDRLEKTMTHEQVSVFVVTPALLEEPAEAAHEKLATKKSLEDFDHDIEGINPTTSDPPTHVCGCDCGPA